MSALGMFSLGGFIGFVITFCLFRVQDWSKAPAILSGVMSAAIAGGLFAIIKVFEQQSGGPLGTGVFYYPLGLAYGALTTHLEWLGDRKGEVWVRIGHAASWVILTGLMVALFLFPDFRSLLPT